MLVRLSLVLSLLSGFAHAQTASRAPGGPTELLPDAVTQPIRHAGTYHVSTGAWTRSKRPAAARGVQDVVYSNTASTGYFTSGGGTGSLYPGSRNFDEGSLPGIGNGTLTSSSGLSPRTTYHVDGFQIGYCDQGAPGTGGWALEFYSAYDPCNLPSSAPDAVVSLTSLPANGCWTVTIDLSGGQEFCLVAEGGDEVWNDDPNRDSFGWSFTYAGADGTAEAGFLLAGDPRSTDPNWVPGPFSLPTDGTNTYFGAPSGCPGQGTGFLTRDAWLLEDPTGVGTACYFFGGYRNRFGCGGPQGRPFASFHMEIYANSSCDFGTIYCTSNPNSSGQPGDLVLRGSDVASNNDATLIATGLPTSRPFGFFITSTQQAATPGPIVGSQGILCLGGSIGRLIAPGQVKRATGGGRFELSTASGEWSLTSIPTSTTNYAAMAGMTSNFQLWHRDLPMMSNTTNALAVTWR